MNRKYNKFRVEDINNGLNPDNIYVDVKVSNNENDRGINMEFLQRKTEPILDNPSDYYLSLIRWKIPAFSFPLLIFPIQNNQPDPNLSEYSVTLETSTDVVQFYLYFFNRNSTSSPSNAIPEQKVSYYYWIYEYQHLLDILNQALANAFNLVTGKPIGSEPPFMIWNPQSKLFSLVAQRTFYDVSYNADPYLNPTNPPTYNSDIKVFFNFKLYQLFNGIAVKIFPESSVSLGRDAQILIGNYNNNGYPNNIFPSLPDYVEIRQQFSSISSWTPVQQILFTTQLIPTQSEYTSVSNDSYKKILTDFEPVLSTNSDVRETFQYFPQSVYRLVDLIGTNPLYSIDLKVTWLDINGNEYIASIAYDQQFSAKIIFAKRDLYKNYNIIYQ